MPEAFVWAVIAYAAGSVGLVCSSYAAIRFRADPQPERARAAFWWSALGNTALLAMTGASIVIAFTKPNPIAMALGRHIPAWAAAAMPWLIPVLGIVLLMNFAGFIATAVFGRPAEYPAPCRKNFGSCTPWFAACERYALLLGHTYKIFITDDMLCGARVRGTAIGPETPDDATLEQSYWVCSINESLYERMDVTKPEFLALHRKNFQMRWRDIADAELDPDQHWGMSELTNSGTLILHHHSGKRRKFILLGDQDGNGLVRQILETVRRTRGDPAR
jgi:hypothetical protein